MKSVRLIVLFVILMANETFSQTTNSISGKVSNEKNKPLEGASIAIHELQKGTITNEKGFFIFENIPNGTYHLHISYLGYKCVHHNIVKIENNNYFRVYKMQPDNQNLEEIVIEGNSAEKRKNEHTTSIEIIDNKFINHNINSSLMKSLEKLPGISSMEIGQGFSKPVIRGLSFNRVAVTENGIKQEGQQWGADHGLEIDQFGIENIEIIKGPASLKYGSDAIGGVVQVMPASIPNKHTTENEIQFIGKSLNSLYGFSAMSKYRKNDWHYYLRHTQMNFGDYKVPADSFFYNRFRLPIENKSLKNTAGTEKDIYLTTGWLKVNYKTSVSISNVFSKTGFFPGSHGIPNADKLTDDGNKRNIGLPYQQVNHLKLMSNTTFFMSTGSIKLNIGFQENFRQEWSEFHTHYPTQQPPKITPDLETEFRLHTYSGDLKYNRMKNNSAFTTGISTQYQNNMIDGYMFLLPDYTRASAGVFMYEQYNISNNLIVTGGVRFDYGQTAIAPYYSVYTERFKSPDFTAHFYDFSWALGTSYMINSKLNMNGNIGKSFRMPNASELSANGIHHGSFRYEVGDTAIVSEYSYQVDMGLSYRGNKLNVEVDLFANYFPNFIFLSPTGSYLHPKGYEIKEADAGQVYQYVQSEAFRAGVDFLLRYKIFKNLSVYSAGEYVYATDLTYPIPFTPPLAVFSELKYTIPQIFELINNITFRIHHNYNATQNRNARNELQTSGYHLVGSSISVNMRILNQNVNFAFQAQNLLDTKYFNHLSFYRLIELPEAGRNYQIMIKIPLNKTFSQ